MYKLQWRQNLHKLTATTLYMNSTERLPWSFQCHFCPSQHAMLWGLMCPKRQCITGWDENFVTSTTNYGTLLTLIKTLNGPEMSFAVTTDQPKNEPKIILWEKSCIFVKICLTASIRQYWLRAGIKQWWWWLQHTSSLKHVQFLICWGRTRSCCRRQLINYCTKVYSQAQGTASTGHV